MRPRRLRAGLAAAATLGLGLAVHEGHLPLGPFADKAGDALYALLLYGVLVVLFPAKAPRRLALLAGGLCCAIELSQLFHADWLDALRRTRLGGLALGRGFDAMDGIAYGLGAAAGLALERLAALGLKRPATHGIEPLRSRPEAAGPGESSPSASDGR